MSVSVAVAVAPVPAVSRGARGRTEGEARSTSKARRGWRDVAQLATNLYGERERDNDEMG